MGLRIATNVAALNAHRQLSINDAKLSVSLERLSSGYRINRAKDDAAGLSISNKLLVQAKSMGVASQNTSQANSMLQVAEGGMDQIYNMLERLKQLATQAASANNASNLADINEEAAALKNEIDRIGNSTTFQGTNLLTGFGTHTAIIGGSTSNNNLTAANTYNFDVTAASNTEYSVAYGGSASMTLIIKNLATSVSQTLTAQGSGETTYDFSEMGISFQTTEAWLYSTSLSTIATALDGFSVDVSNADFQIGEKNDSNYRISFQLDDVRTTALSVNGISLNTATNAQSAMTSIDNAIDALNTIRGKVGAIQNRLDYTYANLATAIENTGAAASVIKDVDMAAEMVSFTKSQILLQAGTAMLAQANMAPQNVLQLLG